MIEHRRDKRRQQIAVGRVHFDHIEPGGLRAVHGGHVFRQNAIHIVTGHCPGKRAIGVEGHCAGRQQRPLFFFWEGLVEDFRIPFPRFKGSALGARMTYLNGHFGLGVLVNEIGDAPPGLGVCVAPNASAPRGNTAISTDVGHLRIHQRGATLCQATVVHEVPVIR